MGSRYTQNHHISAQVRWDRITYQRLQRLLITLANLLVNVNFFEFFTLLEQYLTTDLPIPMS
jgi:hypothetical protein